MDGPWPDNATRPAFQMKIFYPSHVDCFEAAIINRLEPKVQSCIHTSGRRQDLIVSGRQKKWSERQDLNLRRLGPKPSALARLSYAPNAGAEIFTEVTGSAMTISTCPGRAGAFVAASRQRAALSLADEQRRSVETPPRPARRSGD